MNVSEVRQKYIDFFKERGHEVIPSSSLVPTNDPTTLFTGSGMQPLLPYLLGEKHPKGSLLVNSQKAFRAEDIDEVGDNRHTTFFEMLGNWSLGQYFKKEQLTWFFEFLTEVIGLDPNNIYVTTFSGDEGVTISRDDESISIWKELFLKKGIEAEYVELDSLENASEKGMGSGRILGFGVRKNWWSRAGVPDSMPIGEPGGPDSEVFYDFGTSHDPAFGTNCHPNCDCGRFLEIGNSVFMEYIKSSEGQFVPLPQKNVDFGGGLERITAASLNNPDVFAIDVFIERISKLEQLSGKKYSDAPLRKSFRIIADHTRAARMLIEDGVLPSNTGQGYVLRRLLRRAILHGDKINVPLGRLFSDEVEREEENRFRKTLEKGLKEFERLGQKGSLTGEEVFILHSTYGFPIEMTQEIALERGMDLDIDTYTQAIGKHQEKSRTSSVGMFKGGLADHSEQVVKLHTAHHLLLAALQEVLGKEVKQRGSNITGERLRMDFAFDRKLTDDEKKRVENIVNEKIMEALPVTKKEMPRDEAEKIGAEMEFGQKYPDTVSVYSVVNTDGSAFSTEFCGGPHVSNTQELGTFKILKEEASSAGIRRIKGVLQ